MSVKGKVGLSLFWRSLSPFASSAAINAINKSLGVISVQIKLLVTQPGVMQINRAKASRITARHVSGIRRP